MRIHFSQILQILFAQLIFLLVGQRHFFYFRDKPITHTLHILLPDVNIWQIQIFRLLFYFLFVRFLVLFRVHFAEILTDQSSVLFSVVFFFFVCIFANLRILQLMLDSLVALTSPQFLLQFFIFFIDHLVLQPQLADSILFAFDFLRQVIFFKLFKFFFIKRPVQSIDFLQSLGQFLLLGFFLLFVLLLVSLESWHEFLPLFDIVNEFGILLFPLICILLYVLQFIFDALYLLLLALLFLELQFKFFLLFSALLYLLFMLLELLHFFMTTFLLFLQFQELLLNLFLFFRLVTMVIEQQFLCCILILLDELLDAKLCLIFRFVYVFDCINLLITLLLLQSGFSTFILVQLLQLFVFIFLVLLILFIFFLFLTLTFF